MGFTTKMLRMMEERGITVSELARMVGTRQSTIASMITRDSSRISIDLLIKIAHALGTTADELLSDEAPKTYTLTAEELEIVKAYRTAGEETKTAARNVLGVRLERGSSCSDAADRFPAEVIA